MKASVLDRAGEISTDPFPHIVIHDCLPWDYYAELLFHRPPGEEIARGQGQNLRFDLPAKVILQTMLDPWWSFVHYHTSPAFLNEVVGLFPTFESVPGISSSVGPRGMGKHDINMDCQIGVNTPVKERGRVRGPHLDSPLQFFGAMLYMTDPEDTAGGDLILYRWKGVRRTYGKAEVEDQHVEEVKRVPYRANTLVMFASSADSVHGVSIREPTEHYRSLVNFIGEAKVPLFEMPHV